MVKFRSLASHLRTGLVMALVVISTVGCSSNRWGFPYRTSLQQGNWITKDQVALLRAGMTREQVRFTLGTSTLNNALHANRWDYPYYYRSGSGQVEERTLTVFFDDGRLTSWKGEEQPELQPFQIARDEVKTSVQEAKQNELYRERLDSDAALLTPILPGLVLDQTQIETPLTDPQALPVTPNDAPVRMP